MSGANLTDKCPECDATTPPECRTCGARFQFPAEALSARIDALTPEQLLEIARAVEQSGGRMMQKSSVLRAALRAVLGEG